MHHANSTQVLGIPFDAGAVEDDVCPQCRTKIPFSHYALHMGQGDMFNAAFTCPCPHCKETVTLTKSNMELFALKSRVYLTLEHIAYENAVTRIKIGSNLPMFETQLSNGLGAFRTFFAVASSPSQLKSVSDFRLTKIMNAMEKHLLAGDLEIVSLALR